MKNKNKNKNDSKKRILIFIERDTWTNTYGTYV